MSNTTSLKKTMLFLHRPIMILVFTGILILCVGFFYYYHFHTDGLSAKHEDWALFATFFNGILNPFLLAGTIYYFAKQLNEIQINNHKRNLVDLNSMLGRGINANKKYTKEMMNLILMEQQKRGVSAKKSPEDINDYVEYMKKHIEEMENESKFIKKMIGEIYYKIDFKSVKHLDDFEINLEREEVEKGTKRRNEIEK